MTQGHQSHRWDQSKQQSIITSRTDNKVTEVKINKPLPDEWFKMDFIEGTEVQDRRFGNFSKYPYKADQTPEPQSDLQVKEEDGSLGSTNQLWGRITTELSAEVIEARDKVLAQADMRIRSGLRELSETFPQLNKARDYERTITGASAKGRISIGLFYAHEGKAKTMKIPVPEDEQSSVLVVIQPPFITETQLSIGPIYPNLGLVGQVSTSAGEPQLAAELNELVNTALVPLKQLDEDMGEQPPDVQIERGQRTIGENEQQSGNGPAWIASDQSGANKSDYALEFNGSGDYVEIPSSPSLDIRGSLTLSAWVKNDGDNDGQIIWRGDNQLGKDPYQLHVANNRMKFRLNPLDGNVTYNAESTETLDSNWHLWTATYDSKAKTMCLYKDGQLESTAEAPIGFEYDTSNMWNVIGAVDFGNWQHFRGAIDEVRIWNRALTLREIQQAADGIYITNAPELVAHWNFNEAEGNTIHDISPNNNLGQLHTWTGRIGYISPRRQLQGPSLSVKTVESSYSQKRWQEFDGTGDYVEVPDNPSLNLMNQLTFEAWINFEVGGTYNPRIVSKGWAWGSNKGWEFMVTGTGERRALGLDIIGFGQFRSASSLAANTWYHVAATYDGSEVKFFINCQQDRSWRVSGSIPTNDENLNIARNSQNFTDLYKGKIAEVRIWNVARTADEICRDMRRELTGKEDGLVGCWPFGREAGDIVRDISPNSNDGRVISSSAASKPGSKSAVQTVGESIASDHELPENIDRDHLLGWYKLPRRHYRTRQIIPGPGTLIPVFKTDGTYYSVCRGFEAPLKECPNGLEWAFMPSSMAGTTIGLDVSSTRYYIIIEDSAAQYEGDYSTSGEKQYMTKIDEPPPLLDPTTEPPRTYDDFLGWYQPVWFPVALEIQKEGERYLCVVKEPTESAVWKTQGKPIELAPLPDRLGFSGFDRHPRKILTYNDTFKRFEITEQQEKRQPAVIRMPLARVSPHPEIPATPEHVRIGIPSWH